MSKTFQDSLSIDMNSSSIISYKNILITRKFYTISSITVYAVKKKSL